jgi:hypothetical protein
MTEKKHKQWEYTGHGNRRRSIVPKVRMNGFTLPEELYQKAMPHITEQGYTQFMTDAVKLYVAVLRNEQD